MKNYFIFEVTDYFLENLSYYIKEYPALKNKVEKGTDEFQSLTIKVDNLVKPLKKGMYILTNEEEILDVIIQEDLTKFLRKNKSENITIY